MTSTVHVDTFWIQAAVRDLMYAWTQSDKQTSEALNYYITAHKLNELLPPAAKVDIPSVH